MKDAIKTFLRRKGGNFLSPPGVDWLIDIERVTRSSAKIQRVLDIGANVGQTTIRIHRVFPKADIWSFEPIASTFAELKSNTAHLKNVTPLDLALGAESGTALAKIHPTYSQVNAIIKKPEDMPDLEGKNALERVTVSTVDRFCMKHGLTEIDILKTDTEGYDLEVLKGARGLLSAGRVRFIYIEVSFRSGDNAHTSFFEAYQELIPFGFRFVGLYETYPMLYFPEDLSYCNALFMLSEPPAACSA